ncbi:ROK family protein [Subtercola boreus]|uniref:ROK family protein n=1 Tax=Subtercola boreus TaxID=120213 RepID=UPI00209BED9D|nr:ROK family protein [Subtercola boreus]
MTQTDELVLSIDCGGTKVEAALVDAEGRVLEASRYRQPTGPQRTAEALALQVRSVVQDSLASMPGDSKLRGIGVGSAGPINLKRGSVSPVNLAVWQDFDIRSLVEAAAAEMGYESNAVIRLDGLCIALAEHWVGAAMGRDTVLGMIVLTGIGGGIITGGRMTLGATGNAGHIGQIEVAGYTAPTGGCTLEEIASGPSTVRWARTLGWNGRTGEDLAISYAEGETVAVRAVQRSASAIGRALASVSTLLDLEMVVIGGGSSRVTPDLFALIRQSVLRHAPLDYVQDMQIIPTGLNEDGPLIGAAALVWTNAAEVKPR